MTTPLFTDDPFDPLMAMLAEACEDAGLDPEHVAVASNRNGTDYALVLVVGDQWEGNALTDDYLRSADRSSVDRIIAGLKARIDWP